MFSSDKAKSSLSNLLYVRISAAVTISGPVRAATHSTMTYQPGLVIGWASEKTKPHPHHQAPGCGLKKAGSVDPLSRWSAVSRNVGLGPNSLDGPADAKYMGGGAG